MKKHLITLALGIALALGSFVACSNKTTPAETCHEIHLSEIEDYLDEETLEEVNHHLNLEEEKYYTCGEHHLFAIGFDELSEEGKLDLANAIYYAMAEKLGIVVEVPISSYEELMDASIKMLAYYLDEHFFK